MNGIVEHINIVAYTTVNSSLQLSGRFKSTVNGKYILICRTNYVSDVAYRLSTYFIYIVKISYCINFQIRNSEVLSIKLDWIFILCS
jgi:hypothetical protein